MTTASLLQRQGVAALSATDFKDGNIIDDATFYDKDSMTISEIQNFLNRQIPNCDTWGTSPSGYGSLTRAQYAQQIMGWHAPPYVCLNNYHENPTTNETSFEKGGGSFEGGISAAQIIYDASQSYGISPKVLLVMLKKESAGPLTYDSWPLKSQYKYAMGYGCPDSGPNYSANCTDARAGFYKQITLAAWQLKYYKDHPNDYRYKLGWNTIQYAPDPACGTKQVFIDNIATLSLYIYTPYVPNAGSLTNYPGQAPCGAYGNRNFFMFFNEWFGSTHRLGADDIRKKYEIMGGNSSWLGLETDVIRSINKSNLYQSFEHGKIYWSSNTGAWPVRDGAVSIRYSDVNAVYGYLGYPRGDEKPIIKNGLQVGIWQPYEGGQIYWSSETSAWDIRYGAMFSRFSEIGYEGSYLGFPVAGEKKMTKSGVYQEFQGGLMYWQPGHPSRDVSNKIIDGYSKVGYDASYLGRPLNNTYCGLKNDGCWQLFEGGKVYWSPTSGSHDIHNGAVNNKYAELKYENGPLGYPTGSEVQTGKSCGIYKDVRQNFQGGVLYWSACSTPSVTVELKSVIP